MLEKFNNWFTGCIKHSCDEWFEIKQRRDRESCTGYRSCL